MEENHLREIERLVTAYCEKEGVVPQGCQLQVSLSLRPVSLVEVKIEEYRVDQVSSEVLESAIMDCDAAKLLADYLEGIHYHRPSASKIVNSISRIIGKKDPTVRDVVYFSNEDCRWLKYRNLGEKGLKHIDHWLATIGLKRLPQPH